MKDGKIDLTILRAMILLVVHLSLIPTLYSLYKSDSAGTNVKSELISDITDDITERIEALKEKIILQKNYRDKKDVYLFKYTSFFISVY